MGVPEEQFWQDGRIRVDSDGYEAYYDAVDSCWVSQGRMMIMMMTMTMVINALIRRWLSVVAAQAYGCTPP